MQEVRPLTVGMLIQVLRNLPPDTLIWTTEPQKPLDLNTIKKNAELMLYERQGEVRLYFNTHLLESSDLGPYWCNVLKLSPVWERIGTLTMIKYGFGISPKRN